MIRLSIPTPIMLLGAVLALMPCASARAAHPGEYEVKAAFIHNIAKFVEWPPSAGAAGSLKLCVIGQDPFGGALDVLQGKAIRDKVWEVRHASSSTNLRECGVLFVSASERDNLREVLNATRGGAVLTVGDTEGYAEQGVMVNFYLQEDMVRMEINVDAARQAGLRISSQLLKLARIAGGIR